MNAYFIKIFNEEPIEKFDLQSIKGGKSCNL